MSNSIIGHNLMNLSVAWGIVYEKISKHLYNSLLTNLVLDLNAVALLLYWKRIKTWRHFWYSQITAKPSIQLMTIFFITSWKILFFSLSAVKSFSCSVLWGVPQGSIHCLLLCIMYSNELPSHINHNCYHL